MKTDKKFIIGITGGIACGKSEVCRILREMGFTHIDADEVAHKVLTFPETKTAVRDAFGEGVFGADGEIDRKALGRIVFADEKKLELLESVTHPLIIRAILRRAEAVAGPVVIEAVELISSGLGEKCDFIWYVRADREIQMERLVRNRNMSPEDAAARLDAQLDNDWDLSVMDAVITSSVPLELMEKNVRNLAESCYNQIGS